MAARIDLHTHSTHSDGVMSPTQLLQRAAAFDVDVIALTDHDTTAGVAEAADVADELGLTLVHGVEISVTWRSRTIHVVGLNIDIHHRPLQDGLCRLRAERDWRSAEIGRRLQRRGITGACEGARALAGGASLNRTHFARFLMQEGYGKTLQDVFRHFLVRGKPGHVEGRWAALQEAVTWITSAGGVAVLAHPMRYRLTATKLRELLAEFHVAGGRAVEVISGNQTEDAARTVARQAARYDLYASLGSDFHEPGLYAPELGSLGPLPEGCRPIWDLWQGGRGNVVRVS